MSQPVTINVFIAIFRDFSILRRFKMILVMFHQKAFTSKLEAVSTL